MYILCIRVSIIKLTLIFNLVSSVIIYTIIHPLQHIRMTLSIIGIPLIIK